MSVSVNPPPQHRLPDKILNDPELRDFFLYQQEYLYKMWLRTGGGVDLISNIEVEQITSISADSVLAAKIARLEERVDTLEDSDKSSILNNKITRLQALVDELIEELMAELRLQRPDRVNEQSVVENLGLIIMRLDLLSKILDSGAGTGMTIDDIEEA